MIKLFKSFFKSKPFAGSWYSFEDDRVVIFSDKAYDKFSKLMNYDEITQWRIGVMRRAMLIFIQEKYSVCAITFDAGVKYKLDKYPVGTEIHWKPEYDKIKGKISA